MNKLTQQLHHLDIQFEEMRKDFQKLQVMVEKENEKEPEYDFIRLEQYAKNKKFGIHILDQCSETERYRYCCMLAAAIPLIGFSHKQIQQYFFIFRLYHTFSDKDIQEELRRDSQIISMDEWDRAAGDFPDAVKENLLVDTLLMCMIDGTMEEPQMEYFSELAAYLLQDFNKTKKYAELVRAILERDNEWFFHSLSESDFGQYYSYFEPQFYSTDSWDELINCKYQYVLLYNCQITDMNAIYNLDQLKKKKIYFYNCHFEKIIGLSAQKTETVFRNCRFCDCGILSEVPYQYSDLFPDNEENIEWYVLNLKNSIILETVFERCLFQKIGRTDIVEEFFNIKIGRTEIVEEYLNKGEKGCIKKGCIKIEGSRIEKCLFKECKAGTGEEKMENNYDLNYQSIIWSKNSQVEANTFENCFFVKNRCLNNGSKEYINCIIKNYSGQCSDNIFKNCGYYVHGVSRDNAILKSPVNPAFFCSMLPGVFPEEQRYIVETKPLKLYGCVASSKDMEKCILWSDSKCKVTGNSYTDCQAEEEEIRG